jgi:ubiquinone/menaquinone biosynthesis C-methylase UbiE
MSADSPYPELKKTHTMAHTGRPWKDYKPPPSGAVWSVINAGNTYWMLVAAIDLGVFDALEPGTPTTANELSANLGVSQDGLRHLLDCLVTLEFLDQIDGLYELTETAERYLRSDGPASMVSLVRVSPGPIENWMGLAETIRSGHVKTPIDDDIAGFYHPLISATFPTQYRVASRLGAIMGWSRYTNLRVLDLGAGAAPWSSALLEQAKNSTAVVNDFQLIVEVAEATMASKGFSECCEFRAGNFHEIDIEEGGYDMVFLGHVCRTEGEDRTDSLVKRAVAGLKPGGAIVVADYFSDNDRRANAFGVMMGLTMLANTRYGGAITFDQMYRHLAVNQMENIRVLEPIGANMVFVGTKTVRG